jgi:hypothetical protein
LFVPEKAHQQQLEKDPSAAPNQSQRAGKPSQFLPVWHYIEDDRQNFTRHVTEPTREQRNRANRPTRLVPTTPLPIRGTKQIRFIQTLSHLGVVFLGSPSYKVTFVQIRSLLDG